MIESPSKGLFNVYQLTCKRMSEVNKSFLCGDYGGLWGISYIRAIPSEITFELLQSDQPTALRADT